MNDSHFKTLSFLLKCVLLLQLVYSINYPFGAEATQSELYVRMSKIEAQNRRHENEISLLKTKKVEDRKEIYQLRERVALLEDSTFTNESSFEKPKRSKRPVRLLPPHILRPYNIYNIQINIKNLSIEFKCVTVIKIMKKMRPKKRQTNLINDSTALRPAATNYTSLGTL